MVSYTMTTNTEEISQSPPSRWRAMTINNCNYRQEISVTAFNKREEGERTEKAKKADNGGDFQL